MKKKFWRLLLLLSLLFVLYIIGGIIHGTITNYEPEEKITIAPTLPANLPALITDSTFSIMTWNVGYAGLSADCNVFYPSQGMFLSNGKMIRPEKNIVQRNIDGGIDFIKKNLPEFVLIQEMDVKAKRSHYLPMYDSYQQEVKNMGSAFSTNFLVQRVPTPLLQPWDAYGYAHSGTAAFFKYKPKENTRYQLPAKHPWPNSIFHLDRCLSLNRFSTAWGKDVVIVNLHNSAFDKGGIMKAQEMEYLRDLILPEYETGNYVIVGGDWNQSPPFFPSHTFSKGKRKKSPGQNIAAEFFPEDWSWIFDPETPTVRSTVDNYDPKETPQALIDFFLISPNCQATQVYTFDQQFEFSDHQPVRMDVLLK